jgi:uncharacterized protein DUF4345
VTHAKGLSESHALRVAFYAGGLIATLAGLHTAMAGGRSIIGEKHASASVESELRFYSVFYSAYGLALLRTAPVVDRDARSVRVHAATLFAAGLARAGGWRAVGRPNRLQRFLLAAELGVPPLLVVLESRAHTQ